MGVRDRLGTGSEDNLRMKRTVRVDAVQSGGRNDGHLTLTQGTLGGQLLLTARVHLQDRRSHDTAPVYQHHN